MEASGWGVKGSASASFGRSTSVGTTKVKQSASEDNVAKEDLDAQYSQYIRVSLALRYESAIGNTAASEGSSRP